MSDEELWSSLEADILEAAEAVVALARDHPDGEGLQKSYATALFAKAGSRFLILTAGHALPRNAPAPHVHGPTRTVRPSSKPRWLEKFTGLTLPADIAHVLLTPEEAERLAIPRALDLSATRSDSIGDPEHTYIAMGLPVSRSEVDRKRELGKGDCVVIAAHGADASVYTSNGGALQTHLILKYDRRRVRPREMNIDTTGPHPSGMSGGAMLIVKDMGGNPRFLELEFVAMIHRFDESQGILIGTRIPVLLESLRLNYPELAAELPAPGRIKFIRNESSPQSNRKYDDEV